MADKDFKIGISTKADTSGAKEAEAALAATAAAAEEIDDALSTSGASPLDEVAVDARQAEEAVEELARAADDAEDSLEQMAVGGFDQVSSQSDEASAAVKRLNESLGIVEKTEAERAAHRAQFLTAAEREVAEVERLANAHRKEAQAIRDIPDATPQAIRSLDALEEEVRQLMRELRTLPVGSAEFTALAGRVKVAQTALDDAERSARKLGATTRRGGNAGMALLEFQRAFEDFTYAGLRGASNNLPGLIAMLGGGPGLAGVLGLGAVAATIFAPKLGMIGQNAKDAQKDVDGLRDSLGEMEKAISADNTEAIEKSALSRAEGLEATLKAIVEGSKGADSKDELEALRLRSEAEVSTAKARLEVAKLEAQIAKASAEERLRLEEKREERLRQILEIERNTTEELRKQALEAANRKAVEAKEKLTAVDGATQKAELEVTAVRSRLQEADEEVARLQQERIKRLQSLGEHENRLVAKLAELEKRAILTGGASAVGDYEEYLGLRGELSSVRKQSEIAQRPSEREIIAGEKSKAISEGELAKAEEIFAGLAEDQRAAAEELKRALASSNQLKATQQIERSRDEQIAAVNEDGRVQQKDRADQERRIQETLGDLGALADELAKNDATAPLAESIRAALSDKKLTVEELDKLGGEFRTYDRQIGSLGATMLEHARGLTERLGTLETEFRKLQSQQGNKNY
ncbi:hypothetical protein [Haloferula sargassicola]|uniref:Uncharacterized protein n=1 Tax=Haloferula sargassicola TaxID=490096 RepID=A0ABP9UKC2_9BACT